MTWNWWNCDAVDYDFMIECMCTNEWFGFYCWFFCFCFCFCFCFLFFFSFFCLFIVSNMWNDHLLQSILICFVKKSPVFQLKPFSPTIRVSCCSLFFNNGSIMLQTDPVKWQQTCQYVYIITTTLKFPSKLTSLIVLPWLCYHRWEHLWSLDRIHCQFVYGQKQKCQANISLFNLCDRHQQCWASTLVWCVVASLSIPCHLFLLRTYWMKFSCHPQVFLACRRIILRGNLESLGLVDPEETSI